MAEATYKKKEHSSDKQVEQINVAPHSLEAEQAVLGGIMLDNAHWDNVAERVQAGDFYNYAHRVIFEQMVELARHNRPIDIITLDQVLKNKGVLQDVGGFAYLAELSKNTPSAANILAYADIVSERAIRRELISASNKIAEISYNPKGMAVKDVLDEAERAVFHIAEKRTASDQGPKKIDDILPKIGLLVLSSISEALPLVILEGYAAGVPCVSTDVGSCRQLIEGFGDEDRALGISGEVVGIADPDALAHAMMKLLCDPVYWQTAQTAGIHRVEHYYTQDMMFNHYRQIYTSVLEQSRVLDDNANQIQQQKQKRKCPWQG